MNKIIALNILWLMVALVMFDWGYTVGGYEGMDLQSSFGRFRCGFLAANVTEKCMNYQQAPLHQFNPFPVNLGHALSHFDFNDL